MTDATPRRDQAAAFALIAALAVMLVPLPPAVLDALLTFNIALSLLIVMAVLHTSRPVEFSTFPSVLLFTAVFRLALNVASTRLILGDAQAGKVIATFGDYVVGGSYLVGAIVFVILVIIQFVVITKGQNRISEVAARFTLDAMPGKQMAIDADLNAGILTNEEAQARRRELAAEAQFYGAMDGAGKFVRGDAIAALLITAINIGGGLLIGILDRGMPLADALRTYTLLTVGDGLVSQVPALLVSTSAGVLTAKGASEAAIGRELSQQLFARPLAGRAAGLLVAALALLPGMPMLPFLLLGGGLFWLARQASTAALRTEPEKPAAEGKDAAGPEAEEMLAVDRLAVEIGYRLITLVGSGRQGGLLEQIRALRNQFAGRLGLVLPPIRVRDDARLEPDEYRILIDGQEVARGRLKVGHWLAMDPGGVCTDGATLRGTETTEPAFGLPAKWIADADKAHAEVIGMTVIDAGTVLVTHLSETLRRHAGEILTRDDVKALLENLEQAAPAVVDEVVPKLLGVGQVQAVLRRLLVEGVSIRNLRAILEALADHAAETKDPRALTEHARVALARAIVAPYLDSDGTLRAAVVDPTLERTLAETLGGNRGLEDLPGGFLAQFVDRTAEALAAMAREGRDPVLLTRTALRPFLAETIAGVVPNAAVLSYQETRAARKVETVSRIAVPS